MVLMKVICQANGGFVGRRIIKPGKTERVQAEAALAATQPGRAKRMGRLITALVRRYLLVRLEDGPPVNAPEEAFDDTKCDETSDVNPERVDVVFLLPFVNRQAGPEASVEAAESRPLDRFPVSCRAGEQRQRSIINVRCGTWQSGGLRSSPSRRQYCAHSSMTWSAIDKVWKEGLMVYLVN